MDDRIIICRKDECIVSAVFRGNECFRLSVCKDNDMLRLGSIYIGRIASVVDNVKACFADIGLETNVYVPFNKLEGALAVPEHADGRIHQGDSVLLQIDRLPSGSKPASATGEISLAGNATVLLRSRKGLSFSKMITVPGYRDSMREAFRDKIGDDYGVMLRTNAPYFDTDKVLTEYELLKKEYEEILRRFAFGRPGTLIRDGLPDYMTMFRDEHLSDLSEIVTDDETVYARLTDYCSRFLPELSPKIRMYRSDQVSLYHVYDLARCFKEALSGKVYLKSGAEMVFDRTEAMTVVDVNSGKASKSSKKNALFEINQSAAKELARQISLRNLSGMILCDFISAGKEESGRLLESMREYASFDRDINVVDITALGIMEITRVKKEAALYETVKKTGFTP